MKHVSDLSRIFYLFREITVSEGFVMKKFIWLPEAKTAKVNLMTGFIWKEIFSPIMWWSIF